MEEFYRYEEVLYSLGVDQFDDPLPGHDMKINLTTYNVIKKTPKGVWLQHPYRLREEKGKFVLLSARKRYACPTKEEALESFKARKKRQINILSAQLETAKEALSLAENNFKKSLAL